MSEAGKEVKVSNRFAALQEEMNSESSLEIALGSGAAESVCPCDWATEFLTEEAAWRQYRNVLNASGGQMEHFSEKKVCCEFERLRTPLSMIFQVSDARNPMAGLERVKDEEYGRARLPGRHRLEEHCEPCVIPSLAHCLTPVQYRNWCPHCIRTRSKDSDHKRAGSGGSVLTFDSQDHDFCGERRCHYQEQGHSAPVKRTSGHFTAIKEQAFVQECGVTETHILF